MTVSLDPFRQKFSHQAVVNPKTGTACKELKWPFKFILNSLPQVKLEFKSSIEEMRGRMLPEQYGEDFIKVSSVCTEILNSQENKNEIKP